MVKLGARDRAVASLVEFILERFPERVIGDLSPGSAKFLCFKELLRLSPAEAVGAWVESNKLDERTLYWSDGHFVSSYGIPMRLWLNMEMFNLLARVESGAALRELRDAAGDMMAAKMKMLMGEIVKLGPQLGVKSGAAAFVEGSVKALQGALPHVRIDAEMNSQIQGLADIKLSASVVIQPGSSESLYVRDLEPVYGSEIVDKISFTEIRKLAQNISGAAIP